ncbi:MAG: molybdopterin-guanine dinucleotide biosynthesis protein B [Nisaea sp.]|jgi:molybdopterin-guanine dinucleotide biosynthesis protein B|uniref:molybdopterin-guanine dinucleotide biosynthesis protein B n=1 Tax=Nisaea sp. TaxID=2024842 RepID=UPI001B0218FE|nr:molybdopterin-guanine dinucleotide biosynthesis protein B [Nisaea sp.]MBO6561838.1 molybdopterin-guanine dinucleotide biosynthesis protein B [Nisaea sp.]
MKIFGLVGWSGSGKTTLLVKLLPELVARGIRVSTMKHAHHTFDVDKPGKDSYEHREAGATEVLITSANRWALMHENRDAPEPTIEDLLPHMSPVDLLIIEGFKEHAHEKLEIFRRETGKSLLQPNDPMIRAVASDGPVEEATVPVLDLNDVPALADYILDITGLSKAA